jgi:hypothetical protein
MNVYLVRIDGLHHMSSAAVVAESAEDASDVVMAELKERMLGLP